MSILSGTEKLIKEADRRFKTIDDKLIYVNSKLHAIDGQGKRLKDEHGNLHPDWIGKSEFYRKLGTVENRLDKRTEEVAKDQLQNLIDQRDEEKKQLEDTLLEIDVEKANGNTFAVLALRKFYFDYKPYLSSLEEEIMALFDRGALSKYEKPTEELPVTV